MIAVLALAAALGAAQEPPRTGHWEKKPSALLFFDSDGDLAGEHHLGPSDDGAKLAKGGVSKDGRFAWLFEKTTNWNVGRTKMLGSQRRLRLLGSDGRALWESADADEPLNGGDPLLFSADGETTLDSERAARGWRVVTRSYMGIVLTEAGPFHELQEIALTPDARFAMARWTVPDQSATHTFLDLTKKTRKDVASDTFELGQARLADDGKVYSSGKVVLDLAAPAPEKK